jgi:hypothetical protein
MNQEENFDLSSLTQRFELIKGSGADREEENGVKKPPTKIPKISMQETLSKLKRLSKNKVIPDLSTAMIELDKTSPDSKKNSLLNLKKRLIKISSVVSAFTTLKKSEEPQYEKLTNNQLRLINDWAWFSKPATTTSAEVIKA